MYHTVTGALLYEGGFLKGAYYGEGKLWDENGNLLYEGDFVNGAFFGHGIRYEASTGKILESGQFKNGILTEPDPPEQVPGQTEPPIQPVNPPENTSPTDDKPDN